MKRRFAQETFPVAPDAIMSIVTNPHAWAAWCPGFLEVSNLSDDPILMGSAWNEDRTLRGVAMRVTARAVEVNAPNAFSYAIAGDAIDAIFRWQTADHPDGSTVSYEVRAEARSWLHRLKGTRNSFLQQQAPALDALRRYVANQSSPPRTDRAIK